MHQGRPSGLQYRVAEAPAAAALCVHRLHACASCAVPDSKSDSIRRRRSPTPGVPICSLGSHCPHCVLHDNSSDWPNVPLGSMTYNFFTKMAGNVGCEAEVVASET